MSDEPSLPPLPKEPLENPFGPERNARKRGLPTYGPPSSSASSDPAFFSSDDDPAVDNYDGQGRRKKRYVGAWYDQHPAFSSDSAMGDEIHILQAPRHHAPASAFMARRQKREFKKLDSGIYMSQDGSSTDTEFEDVDSTSTDSSFIPTKPGPEQRPQLHASEKVARDIILSCFEEGKETVQLSELGLTSLSDKTVEPIGHIRPVPIVEKDVSFEDRDPAVQVFLSLNFLRTVPTSLFNVEHLTFLTLRCNRLTEIPAAIGKLKNLEELNISQNQIRFLPIELLDLVGPGTKLQRLHVRPNPLWGYSSSIFPISIQERNEYAELGRGSRPQCNTTGNCLVAAPFVRTPVEYLDGTVGTVSRFKLPLGSYETESDVLLTIELFSQLEKPREFGFEERSRGARSRVINPKGARSLFEMALLACAKSSYAEDISSWLQEEDSPEGFAEAVDQATKAHLAGGMKCSVCGRKMVLPMTRWIEWHWVNRAEVSFDPTGEYPFLKQGCSWKCVPPVVEPEVKKVVDDDSDYEDEDTITA